MMTHLSRRAALRAATGLTLAAGATALGGRATASPNAVQATLADKVTWWEATSVAGPAAAHISTTTTAVAWRGDGNSRNLTVANVRGTPGRFTGSTLQKTILGDSSDNAPSFAGLTTAYELRFAWSGTNGARSLNVGGLGVDTSTWTLTGRITGRGLVAGDQISCTTTPAWGYSASGRNQLVVANQYGTVVVAEEQYGPFGFAPLTAPGFANPRGAVHSTNDGSQGTFWAWTASDGALTFASILSNGRLTVARSAQTSWFAPSELAYTSADGQFYVAWTTTPGRIAVAQVDQTAIRRGVDPITLVTVLAEQSLASPALLARYATPNTRPAFDLFWTGTDGTGALNAAVVTF